MDLKRFVEYFNKEDNFSRNNNIILTNMEEGYARAELEVKESSLNFMGSLHGGAMFTLADVVAGSSIISYGFNCVTLNSNINFLRPVFKGKIIATAKAVHKGRQTGVTEITITDQDGNIICKGSYTMFITDKEFVFE